jgi:hypothetical protein
MPREMLWQVLAGFRVEGHFLRCCRWCMPRIQYTSTTQAKVSPPTSGANKVWSKVALSAPYCLGYIWMPWRGTWTTKNVMHRP